MIFECLEDYENYLYRQKDLHTHAWGRLIKKEALLRAYALLDYKDRLQFAEDALLNFALWNCCERFCFLDSLLYNYRANPQSILGRKDEANILSHIRDCDTITAKIKECAPKSHKKLTRIFLSFILTSRLSWRSLLPRTPLERFCDYLQMRMFIWKRSLRYRFGI